MDFLKQFEVEKQKFGFHLRQVRINNELTQEALGKLCFINRTEISRIERGLVNLEFYTIIKIAEGLNLDLVLLFNYNENAITIQKTKKLEFDKRYGIEMKSFGKRLFQLRDSRKLIQFDLQIATGIPDSDISRYENGIGNLEFFSFFRLAMALNVEVVDLFKY
jgi:transcriptional regulator with XRE-family HTH domain